MTPERAREIFAEEMEKFGEHRFSELVRDGVDNSHGGLAALKAISRAVEEATAGMMPITDAKSMTHTVSEEAAHAAAAGQWAPDDAMRDAFGKSKTVDSLMFADSDKVQPIHTPVPLTLAELRGAVARGWCHFKNQHKEFDSDLGEAITAEVWLALTSDQRHLPAHIEPDEPRFTEPEVQVTDEELAQMRADKLVDSLADRADKLVDSLADLILINATLEHARVGEIEQTIVRFDAQIPVAAIEALADLIEDLG